MTDRYNSRFAAWVGRRCNAPGGWAITIGQTTFYSVSKDEVDADPKWRRHEDRHKAQWKETGFLKFAVLYLWYSHRFGYFGNPFEVDARKAEEG